MNKRVDVLTSLRFIMMVIIVISHFEFLGTNENDIYYRFFHNSTMAVDFFFMLSGFGLCYSCLFNNKRVQEKNNCKYAWHRVKKLYVLYIISMLLTIPTIILSSINVLGKSIKSIVVINFFKILIMPSMLQSITGLNSLSHMYNGACWFLSTIFILYMIYPYLEKANLKYIEKNKNKKQICLYIFLVILLYLIVYFLFSIIERNTIFDDLKYGSPWIRIFQFILGILICDLFFITNNKKNTSLKEIIIYMLFICWLLLRNNIFIGKLLIFKQLIDISIVAYLIYIFSFENGILSKILNNKKLVFLGNNSMYIFLLHYMFRIIIVPIVEKFIGISKLSNIINVVLIILLTCISVALINYINKKSNNTNCNVTTKKGD